MYRVWVVAPTSERSVQDIRRLPKALDRIVGCKGSKVPELDNRRGRAGKRNQSCPTVPVHIDCDDAIAKREEKFAHLDPY